MDLQPIQNHKLAIFIHSTTMELWKTTFLIEILEHLKATTLLSQCQYLCIVNTGLPIDIPFIETHYKPAKVIHYTDSANMFEIPTIKMLYSFSKMNPNYKILYMHTKGISYSENHVFLPGIRSWNLYMRHCLIDHYLECINLLNIYDSVGCNYRPTEDGNGQHYSGNYWWANASYIATLSINALKNKYDPEFWLLQNEPLFFNIHTMENMYEQCYPLDYYKDVIAHGFRDNILFCKVGFPHSTLCNQLYNIVNTITIALSQSGNKVIILDDFVKDISSMETIPTDQVLDLPTINRYLNQHNITILYKHDVDFVIEKVVYGLKHVKTIDVTESIKRQFVSNNFFYVPHGYSLNELNQEDPCPGKYKQLYVYYKINTIEFQKTFHEKTLVYKGPIVMDFFHYYNKRTSYVNAIDEPWLTRINRKDSRGLAPFFDKLLHHLSFNEYFESKAIDFLKTIPYSAKTNIVHLRNEDDAIQHWSKLNHMEPEDYKNKYETNILDAIRSHIMPHECTIFLTSFVENNPVLDVLREEQYQIYVRENENIGRELNGLIDLHIGGKCDNVFIGNYNIETHDGSSFSHVLYSRFKKDVKCIFIDMVNINSPYKKEYLYNEDNYHEKYYHKYI